MIWDQTWQWKDSLAYMCGCLLWLFHTVSRCFQLFVMSKTFEIHLGGRGASIWDTYTGANTVGMKGSVPLSTRLLRLV